jgi:hypothetical protein
VEVFRFQSVLTKGPACNLGWPRNQSALFHGEIVSEKPKTPDAPINGDEGLKRLAELTRRVMAVPKDEVPTVFARPKKAKRNRHS